MVSKDEAGMDEHVKPLEILEVEEAKERRLFFITRTCLLRGQPFIFVIPFGMNLPMSAIV